jgi:Bacterial TSP3 repeat
MNASSRFSFGLLASVVGLACTVASLAFPPAPHHEIFGLVRDELGNPLTASSTQILLEVGSDTIARTSLLVAGPPGVNYRLAIPIDSGVTADLYKPTALRPTVPFRLRVRIGNAVYLPIEMTGAEKLVTRPGASTRVDLTLGVDSDGDGLPDAWERALMAALGGRRTLADILPGNDDDGDGLSNLQEYLAGTYAFDPEDSFALTIRATELGRSYLDFTAIRGRSYSIQGSTDLQTWSPVTFRNLAEGAKAVPGTVYRSTDVRLFRAVVGPFPDEESAPRFFKLIVY